MIKVNVCTKRNCPVGRLSIEQSSSGDGLYSFCAECSRPKVHTNTAQDKLIKRAILLIVTGLFISASFYVFEDNIRATYKYLLASHLKKEKPTTLDDQTSSVDPSVVASLNLDFLSTADSLTLLYENLFYDNIVTNHNKKGLYFSKDVISDTIWKTDFDNSKVGIIDDYSLSKSQKIDSLNSLLKITADEINSNYPEMNIVSIEIK